ncbi:MAG: WG repeat-containing protein [Lachnospiraceae bacterium]|nr:WG repeat-containing protein [Lachnospiraceae bacterium]
MRKLVIPSIITLIVIAWISTIYTEIKTPNEYREYVKKADSLAERGLYINALEQYKKAKNIKENYEVELKLLNTYENLNQESEYIQSLKTLISKYPKEAKLYIKLILKYVEEEDYKQLVPFLEKAKTQFPDNEEIKNIYQEIEKKYKINETAYSEITYFKNEQIEAVRDNVILNNDVYENLNFDDENQETKILYGMVSQLIDSNNKYIINDYFKKIRPSEDGNSFWVQDLKGRWYGIDTDLYEIANNAQQNFEEISVLPMEGISTAIIKGKYRFIDQDMKVAENEWDMAGVFSEGLNAVKKGKKWAVVTMDNWNSVKEYPYDDVALNLYGNCSTAGRIVVKKDGYYKILNEKGEEVSDKKYQLLKAFLSNEPTVYESEGKHGFVNTNGEICIKAQYEDALPFTNGYAAVKVKGLWGYINSDNEMIIEPQFQEALPVMSNGTAFIKDEFGYWNQIIMYILQYK